MTQRFCVTPCRATRPRENRVYQKSEGQRGTLESSSPALYIRHSLLEKAIPVLFSEQRTMTKQNP